MTFLREEGLSAFLPYNDRNECFIEECGYYYTSSSTVISGRMPTRPG
jgi:hypothetical protein